MFQVIDLTGPISSSPAGSRAHPAPLKRSAAVSTNRIQTKSLPKKISRQSLLPNSQSTASLSIHPTPALHSTSASSITVHYKDRNKPLERLSSTESKILTEESEIEISDDELPGPSPIFPSNTSSIPTVSPTASQPDVFSSLESPAPTLLIASNYIPPVTIESSGLNSAVPPSPNTTPHSADSVYPEFDPESVPRVEENFGQWGGAKIRKAKFAAIECREAFDHAILCITYQPTEEIGDLREILLGFRDVLPRELPPLIQRHPGLKVGIAMKNIYEYTPNGTETELDINAPMHFIQSPVGLDDLITMAELFIQDRNATFIRGGSNPHMFAQIPFN